MRRPTLILALTACALALAAGVSSASTTITSFVTVSNSGEDVFDPQVAVDPNGNAFFAWVTDNASGVKVVQARRVSSAGAASPVRTLSSATENSSSPEIAAAPDGTAVVVWQEVQPGESDRMVRSGRILANGAAGTTLTLSDIATDSIEPDVGVDANSQSIATWMVDSSDDEVDARTRTSGDNLGSLENVSDPTPSGSEARHPRVAVSSDGTAVFAYELDVGPVAEVLYNRRAADGAYEDPGSGIEVSDVTATPPDQIQVAVDPTGDAVVTWRQDAGSTNQIRARRIESDEDLPDAAIKDISDPAQNADQPQVDMDGAGKAYLTWRRSNGTITVAQERRLATDSNLTPTQNLAGAGSTNADQPQVAVDALGNATFAWVFGLNVETRGLTAVGELLATQPLTTSGSNTEPRVDANAAGTRWGAYRTDTAGNDTVVGFFDLTPPGFTPPTPPPPAGAAVPAPVGSTENPLCASLRKKLKKAKSKKTKRKIRRKLRRLGC